MNFYAVYCLLLLLCSTMAVELDEDQVGDGEDLEGGFDSAEEGMMEDVENNTIETNSTESENTSGTSSTFLL